jgi:hypothetical protein
MKDVRRVCISSEANGGGWGVFRRKEIHRDGYRPSFRHDQPLDKKHPKGKNIETIREAK